MRIYRPIMGEIAHYDIGCATDATCWRTAFTSTSKTLIVLSSPVETITAIPLSKKLTSKSLIVSVCPVTVCTKLPFLASQRRIFPLIDVVKTIGSFGCQRSRVTLSLSSPGGAHVCLHNPSLAKSHIFKRPSIPPVAHHDGWNGQKPSASTLIGYSISSSSSPLAWRGASKCRRVATNFFFPM